MKKFSKNLITGALVATAVFSSVAVAADQKIGAINVQDVFQSMPQAANIQQTIAAEFKDKTEEVSRLEKDIKYYQEKYQRDAATMSATEKSELEKKIIGLRDEYTNKGQPLQKEIQFRLQEEQNRLLGMIKQAIDVVAAKEKYDMILNTNAVAFIKEEYDVSKAVLAQVSKVK